MIKNYYLFTTFINIVYLGLLTFLRDPFVENYSMFSSSLFGYLIVLVLCLLLSFNLYVTNQINHNKYSYLAFLEILGGIFPYNDGSGNLISDLHVIAAYIAFGALMINTILNIEIYKNYSYKKANFLLKLFIMIFFLDGLIYLKLLGVTGIQQFILLTSTLLINAYISYNIKRYEEE